MIYAALAQRLNQCFARCFVFEPRKWLQDTYKSNFLWAITNMHTTYDPQL